MLSFRHLLLRAQSKLKRDQFAHYQATRAAIAAGLFDEKGAVDKAFTEAMLGESQDSSKHTRRQETQQFSTPQDIAAFTRQFNPK